MEVPEPPAMFVEDKVHDRFVELVLNASETVAANPFAGTTVIVEVPPTPALKVTLVVPAVTAKSCT
jgi:hypothetical protein